MNIQYVRLEAEVCETLNRMAQEQRRTVSELVNEILREQLRKVAEPADRRREIGLIGSQPDLTMPPRSR